MTTLHPEWPDLASDDRDLLERALLAELCWASTPVADRTLAAVAYEDFRSGAHRTLCEAMAELRADGRPIDLAELVDHLEHRGWLAAVGGVSGVAQVVCSGIALGSPVTFAEQLHDHARRDRLAEAGARVHQLAADGAVDPDQVAAMLEEHLPGDLERGVAWVRDVDVDGWHQSRGAGSSTGWPTLDGLFRPERGLFTVVTGVPSMGKSTFTEALLLNLAARDGWRVAVFSPEQAPVERHVAHVASVLAGRPWTALDAAAKAKWQAWIDEHYAWIDSTDGCTLDEVLRRADVIRRARGLDALLIDPWNELDHERPAHVTETQHIGASLTKLRRWGRRRNVATFLVAHPKKLEKTRSGEYPVPSLYDISGSSTFRDKADFGVVVHRDQAAGGDTEIHVVKDRFGGGYRGKRPLRWIPPGTYVEPRDLDPAAVL